MASSGLVTTKQPAASGTSVALPPTKVGVGTLGWTPAAFTTAVPNYGNVVAGSIAVPISTAYFYARFYGWLNPTVTGKYTIGVNATNGCNVFIGDQALISNIAGTDTANRSTAYTKSGTIMLTAGTEYPLVIEWQHGFGVHYQLQLLWTTPLSSIAIIPSANLLCADNATAGLSGTWWNGTLGLWYPTGHGIIDFASTVHPNKTVDNIADGYTYARTTPNQVTGAGRAYSALDANSQIVSQLKSKPAMSTGAFTGTNPLSQSGTTKTISIAAHTIQWGTNSVNYSSGSVTPLAYGAYYVYADDPTFAGGSVTYVSTATPLDIFSNDGRVYFGSIQTIASGGTRPSITGISPTTAAVGMSVTVTGTNFGSTQGSSMLTFNGVIATSITSWGSASIVAQVPSAATTGYVNVTVSGVASTGYYFTVIGTGGSGGGGGGGGYRIY